MRKIFCLHFSKPGWGKIWAWLWRIWIKSNGNRSITTYGTHGHSNWYRAMGHKWEFSILLFPFVFLDVSLLINDTNWGSSKVPYTNVWGWNKMSNVGKWCERDSSKSVSSVWWTIKPYRSWNSLGFFPELNDVMNKMGRTMSKQIKWDMGGVAWYVSLSITVTSVRQNSPKQEFIDIP